MSPAVYQSDASNLNIMTAQQCETNDLDENNNNISQDLEPTVTSNEFKESIRKIELFLKQSDFLFDADDIALFSKFKSRLDLSE